MSDADVGCVMVFSQEEHAAARVTGFREKHYDVKRTPLKSGAAGYTSDANVFRFVLVREKANVGIYLLNVGRRRVFISYWNADGANLGPDTDSIAPGEFKQMGPARDVFWNLHR